jgi:hypothetical protein
VDGAFDGKRSLIWKGVDTNEQTLPTDHGPEMAREHFTKGGQITLAKEFPMVREVCLGM